MNILGIDFGLRKIGLSLGNLSTKFAEPLEVIRYSNDEKVFIRLKQIVDDNAIDKFVVGISEGKSAASANAFALKLRDRFGLGVCLQDETYSTKAAQKKSIEAGIKRKDRRMKEDAYSATVILQNYLDNL